MTDQQVKDTKYTYALNSNLVLQGQNRDGSSRAGPNDLPSGEGESLAGRKLAQFGDRAVREKPQDDAEHQKKLRSVKDKQVLLSNRESLNLKSRKVLDSQQAQTKSLYQVNFSTLQVDQELIYRPSTRETRESYEQIAHVVQRHLGDVPIETIKDAVDEVLAVLKDDGLNDKQRKSDIDALLGVEKLTSSEFESITVLAQLLTDYSVPNDDQRQSKDQALRYQDQQQDIAIELDEDGGQSEDSRNDQVEEVEDDQSDQDELSLSAHEKQDIHGDSAELAQKVTIFETDNQQIPILKSEFSNEKLKIGDIDAHWLKRKLSQEQIAAEDIIQLENTILTNLGDALLAPRECEKKLFTLLTHKRISLVRTLVKSRHLIFFGTKLKQAQTESQRAKIQEEMKQSLLGKQLLIDLNINLVHKKPTEAGDLLKKAEEQIQLASGNKAINIKKGILPVESNPEVRIQADSMKALNLELLKFQQGSRLMANKKCTLPKGSTRLTKAGYEEVYVPAVRSKKADNEQLVAVSSLPLWARQAFPSHMTHFNRIQSKIFRAAFETPNNLLVCAPTGAGKTNIALLACLQLLGEMQTPNPHSQTPSFNLKLFKIIYIAPMKALVAEVVGNFQTRLEPFGIKVKELTGDVHLTRQQIEEANIIVTTPEKWDIITRKSGDRTFIDLVKLIIIDEVHLLHDARGPVLEAIIARTIRQIEETSELVRIVGLSATLPNFEDVAALLRVDPDEGLYYFDNTFRPVPLEQIYIGITEKKAIKRMMLMNEVCYEKVMERAGRHQVLVFAHSRKETARTAKIIRDMALVQERLSAFVKEDSESKKILLEVIVQKKLAVSKDLQDLVPYGIGIHHAGLSKDDRTLVEDLFAAGHIQLLVSTATLAWGVNLPAHTVIIKGTQVYSPEKGKWVELSPQDILQMMGRAGRPQFDTLGEGIILTNHEDLQYYLSLNNQQLPIESQMIQSLSDSLNAEIVLGTVANIQEAVNWLSYSYLYIRMRRNPDLYGVTQEDSENDPTLIQTRINLCHSAALKLQKSAMIKYERRTGTLLATPLGKIASHYYIRCESMQVYNEELKPHMSSIDIFRLFALSKEFENIPIRENEKVELQKFIDRVPVPVKGGVDETATKINILLQAHIARFRLEGYDLNADMIYVTQSASRIMRALFEIALKKGWAQLTENLLNICKMVERRQWYSMTPLRQFCSGQTEAEEGSMDLGGSFDLAEIAKRIEKREQFRWSDFMDFTAQQLGELIKYPKLGKVILSYVHKFPRLEVSAFVQPVTRSTVRIELEVRTHEKFQWDNRFHGGAETFWVIVEDGDAEQILHYEQFILKENKVGQEEHLSFSVPLFDPLPPNYFVKVLSDRWLQAEHIIPVSFKNVILPEKYAAPTLLLDMQSKLVRDLNFEEAIQLYESTDGMKEFSPIQTQAFEKLYHTDSHIFLGVPCGGSEKRVLAELAVFREIQKENYGKIVYLSPKREHCRSVHKSWKLRLGEEGMGLCVELLLNDNPGQLEADLELLSRADIVICTPAKWELLSRKWRQRPQVLQFSLYLFDDLHLLSLDDQGTGALYEAVVSRVRYIQSELLKRSADELKQSSIQRGIRLVGLSAPLANSKEVADWLGVSSTECVFNFHPSVRASCPSLGPLAVSVQSYDHNGRSQRNVLMAKPVYNLLKQSLLPQEATQAIVFVSERKLARLRALDISNMCQSDEAPDQFLRLQTKEERSQFQTQVEGFSFTDAAQMRGLECGVALLHEGQSATEQKFLVNLFRKKVVRVLIATNKLCWSLDFSADLVVVQDPEKYSVTERRYEELSLAELVQMQSLAVSDDAHNDAGSPGSGSASCVIMCHTPKKDYFTRFLQDPLPIESTLAQHLPENLNAEIDSGRIGGIPDAIDWLAWSFLYRRIVKNPNYYGIAGKTAQHINDYLSELAEDSLSSLTQAGCLVLEDNEDRIKQTDLGNIAASYQLRPQTIEIFAQGVSGSSALQTDAHGKVAGLKMRQIFGMLAQAAELWEFMEHREGEESALRILALNQPFDIPSAADFSEADTKANILLQCHFSRKPLPVDLKADQRGLLVPVVRLIHAMVEVLSLTKRGSQEKDGLRASCYSLRQAISCMELSQMVVQATWKNQSPLLQLPFFDVELIENLKQQAGVEDIADFMNMEDNLREKLVPLKEAQMAQLAAVCNRYPNLELIVQTKNEDLGAVSDTKGCTASVGLAITVRRDINEADFSTREEYLEELSIYALPVEAPYYPEEKQENWWVIVGHVQTNKLLSIKKVTTMQQRASLTMDFNIHLGKDLFKQEKPENQKKKVLELQVYLICDSYVGCDLEKQIIVHFQD